MYGANKNENYMFADTDVRGMVFAPKGVAVWPVELLREDWQMVAKSCDHARHVDEVRCMRQKRTEQARRYYSRRKTWPDFARRHCSRAP